MTKWQRTPLIPAILFVVRPSRVRVVRRLILVRTTSKRRARSASVRLPTAAFQLKISLRHITPLIWRRLVVADNCPLGDLHFILQTVLGWSNCHMHAFRFGGGFRQTEYVTADTLADDPGPATLAFDEDSVTLADVIRRKGQVFSYEYDFGDSWQHQIKVEKVLPFDRAMQLPVCLAGVRACPPEDCGGVPGYLRAMSLLRNPKEKDDENFREWLGDFDPEAFDLDSTNRRLRR
jgi:hypothetical protein